MILITFESSAQFTVGILNLENTVISFKIKIIKGFLHFHFSINDPHNQA